MENEDLRAVGGNTANVNDKFNSLTEVARNRAVTLKSRHVVVSL